MKTCKGCGRSLELSSFYPHPQMADGYLNFCKECVRAKVRLYARANPQKELERGRRPDRVAYRRERYFRLKAVDPEGVRRRRAEYQRRYRVSHPGVDAAHSAVKKAVERGLLVVPSSCERCGASGEVQAHHRDYSKRLEVLWLCDRCHKLEHRKPGPA